MKVTSASFLREDERRILARYHAPSENLAETKSPALGVNPGGAVLVERWCIENSRISVSKEAIP